MRKTVCMFLAAGLSLISTNALAEPDNSRSVNFMIFMKNKPSFEFDPIMFGSFSQFIRAMDGARLMLLSHSAKSKHGDVISLQQDVLREKKSGDFDDIGINCQLGFVFDNTTYPEDPDHQISGDCQVIDRFKGEHVSVKAHIPATDLPDRAKGTDVWIEVYEEPKSGVAIYANISKR